MRGRDTDEKGRSFSLHASAWKRAITPKDEDDHFWGNSAVQPHSGALFDAANWRDFPARQERGGQSGFWRTSY